MEHTDWLRMLDCQQKLHHLSRELLPQGKDLTLTASELELLSQLYLWPEESTPLALSRRSGMRKEAVSRCLRPLQEQGLLRREKHPEDERSSLLFLTEAGRKALEANYRPILRPLYELRRRMGPDFETLFELIGQADAALSPERGREDL